MKWNRRTARFLVPFLVLLVSVVGGWALSRPTNSVDVNLNQPITTLSPTIGTNASNTGKKFTFVELVDNATGDKGTIAPAGKPMVVNFWYSTCEPCKREMPALSATSAKYAATVDFIGINPNDSREVATEFLKMYNITYPTFIDDGTQLAEAGVVTLPATFFLDSSGIIVARRAGEITSAEIDSILTNDLKVSP
jgi:thiol-disulfide isomerase/thioredoxin